MAALGARVHLRRNLWAFGVRLRARLGGATIELEVDPTARVGRHVQVQCDRGSRNRFIVGPRAIIRDDILIQLHGGTIEMGVRAEIREACKLNVAGRLILEDSAGFSWGCTVHCNESIVMREMAACSEYVTIVDSRHFHTRDGRWFYDNVESKPVEIGRNVWIAAKSTVMMGSRIGDNCLVAANSVVAGQIDADTVVAGAPARPVRSSLR